MGHRTKTLGLAPLLSAVPPTYLVPCVRGLFSKATLQAVEQKKKFLPSKVEVNFVFFSSTIIPQTGSLCSKLTS